MDKFRVSKDLKRFKTRKYGMVFLFILLLVSNLTTLSQSFYGDIFVAINGILCLARFLLYAQLLICRVRGQGPYTQLLFAIIILEIISFAPQLLLDFEILNIESSIVYYILLDAFSQILLVFLLIDEYQYVQSLTENITFYNKMLSKEDHNNNLN